MFYGISQGKLAWVPVCFGNIPLRVLRVLRVLRAIDV